MDIRFGWASDYGRQSVAVQLDEMDISRIIVEHGPPGADIQSSDLTATEAFRLLSWEAELFVEVKVVEKFGGDKAAGGDLVRENIASIKSLLARVNERKAARAPARAPE